MRTLTTSLSRYLPVYLNGAVLTYNYLYLVLCFDWCCPSNCRNENRSKVYVNEHKTKAYNIMYFLDFTDVTILLTGASSILRLKTGSV